MRTILLAGLLVAASAAQGAPTDDAPPSPSTVTVCDNLVTLRRVMAQETVRPDPDAPAPEPDRTGCSDVKADTIGEVQRRTIIGGAPFECRSIDHGACRWVQP